ncbi:MAG: ornithine cyclodeaminase family protein, partial [Candidatus Hydrothermarchaeota archaeon]|nr:ornithine cyclodeaminase family protein [Candidatus Hydrothermarchaeota archaeon]
MKIFWLSGSEVSKVLEIGEVIKVVEEAFRQHGLKKVQMPPKVYLSFSNGDLRTMPAYIESLGIAGVKIVTAHPENPKKGLPTVMGIIVLNDPETGAPIAVMDGTHLTDVRTGAAGAVAVK